MGTCFKNSFYPKKFANSFDSTKSPNLFGFGNIISPLFSFIITLFQTRRKRCDTKVSHFLL